MSESPQPASEGRIVHVSNPGLDHCQAAIVVRAWGDGRSALNLHVFPDGTNDDRAGVGGDGYWATSVGYHDPADPEPSDLSKTWHWPERVG